MFLCLYSSSGKALLGGPNEGEQAFNLKKLKYFRKKMTAVKQRGNVCVLFRYLLLSCLLFSCQDELLDKVTVYSNDFSEQDDSHITNAKWLEFDGKTVLGWYHSEDITLTLPNLPAHNTVEITVELLIHDSWDGNPDNMGGPDYWFMHLDGDPVINTTFSNTPCGFSFCLYQAYPDNYPRTYEPKTGASATNLPGRCQYEGMTGWTSLYRITRLVRHDSRNLTLLLGGRLKQTNAPDPLCDESWSVAKIEVKTLVVK